MTGITESPILSSSIPNVKEKGKIFAKIEGKGYSRYCYLGSISKIISGYLYLVNPYIPICICLAVCIITTIISWNYEEIEQYEKQKEENVTIKESIRNVKNGFSYILKSSRLRALILMLAVIWGIIQLLEKYQDTLLKDMAISASYISILSAIGQIMTGLSSKRAVDYNKKFKNKSLSIIGVGITVGALMIGGVTILNIPIWRQMIIMVIAFWIRAIMKGFYQILKKQYMGNFANDEILPKIYASNNIVCNIARAIISYLGSVMLIYTNVGIATLLIGIIFIVVILGIAMYMKDKVGIQPRKEGNE